MPEIWSRISLVRRNAYSDDVDEERLLFTLDIFLDRALQHPLTVNMDFDEPCRALTRLINHVHRFSSFTYESEGYGLSILTSYLSHPSSNFPLLEGLSGQIRNEVLEMFAHTAPKLKDLVLSSITTHDSSEIFLFAQLLHLEFYYPYVHEIHTLMDSNHHLVSLKTEISQLDEDETLPIPTICGTIHTLTLCHDPMTWQDYSVLPYLTLPSLTTIHFERNLFYERRAKMVEPHIRQVSIADLNYRSRIFNVTLMQLRCTGLNVGASTFNDGSVVDMIRSRWIPGKRNASSSRESEPQVDCLREFTIRFRNREEAKGVYEPLEDMDRDGMRVVVLWGN
ncbi:hypothetical protein BT96DRAFT_988183 [Gymnopus androsaceus JB14]|uniref:F-box domain-containing protein n=1 Tax=Gymnopus androsaceus JB14 TaxID=1447944 RepID=A0A6A4I6V6_9AGAR|nr:hypothetical protein BT96DRAFT_988183 [Gymnopus androsaceus JB14]